MKASLYDSVRLLIDMRTDRGDRIIPKGTEGAVVECFTKPREGYAVDFHLPDDRELGGYAFENIMVGPEQVEVIERAEPRGEDS